jgi:hypothetical protein
MSQKINRSLFICALAGIALFARAARCAAPDLSGLSESDQALMVFCSGMMLEQIGHDRTPAGQLADALITNLARDTGISEGEARSRMRALQRSYGGWDGVLNGCVDRGWLLNPKSLH